MDNAAVHQAQRMLIDKLKEDPAATPPANKILDWLIGQHVGEEVARVALWDLIDNRGIMLTPDRNLKLPPRQRIVPTAS